MPAPACTCWAGGAGGRASVWAGPASSSAPAAQHPMPCPAPKPSLPRPAPQLLGFPVQLLGVFALPVLGVRYFVDGEVSQPAVTWRPPHDPTAAPFALSSSPDATQSLAAHRTWARMWRRTRWVHGGAARDRGGAAAWRRVTCCGATLPCRGCAARQPAHAPAASPRLWAPARRWPAGQGGRPAARPEGGVRGRRRRQQRRPHAAPVDYVQHRGADEAQAAADVNAGLRDRHHPEAAGARGSACVQRRGGGTAGGTSSTLPLPATWRLLRVCFFVGAVHSPITGMLMC